MKIQSYISVRLVFLSFLFVSCEDYYKPHLEIVPGIMVVESLLTNDTTQNFVRLSNTRDFYSSSPVEWISGAKVELVEFGGPSIRGIERNPGYYAFPYAPVSGKKYLLRIANKSDFFESEIVVMPPLPSIDALYSENKTDKVYKTSSDGIPFPAETPGREISINAPITSKLEYYRFNWRAIMQLEYQPPTNFDSIPPYLPPPMYGWTTIYNNGPFNLAGQKEFSISDKVVNHPVLWLGYNSQAYLDSTNLIPWGWIVIIDQFGVTKDSYDFHTDLNKQFSAEGSLFDPVLTQVYGNIRCKNDPSKIVLGFFDLNSYTQHRYFLSLGYGDEASVIQRRINEYFDIPKDGWTTDGKRPEFWQYK